MSTLILFSLGYLLGGITALLVFGLAVAARRGDSGSTTYAALHVPPEETVGAWRVEAETVQIVADIPQRRA